MIFPILYRIANAGTLEIKIIVDYITSISIHPIVSTKNPLEYLPQ